MAALRLALRRFCDLARGRSAGIYERKAAKAIPNIDPEHLKAAKAIPNIDPEHLKAARQFPKLHVKDADAMALQIFKTLQESPVEGHKDVTLREVRATLKTLAELQEEE